MDLDSWFVWNFGSILFWAMIGLMVWIAGQTKELKAKMKSPILVGFAASLLGGFEIGLSAIVSGALYLLFLYIFRYWYTRLKGKTIESDLNDFSVKNIEVVDDEEPKKEESKTETVVVEPVVVEPEVVVVKKKTLNKKSQ